MQVLQLGPKILVGKGKYGCKYCNEAPKFQLVKLSTGVYYNETPKFQLIKVSINAGITRLNKESTFNATPTCMVDSK